MGIVVVGAGVAGLASSITLARDGNDVVLLDRDGFADEGDGALSPYETRPGCPQRNQGHVFLARARNLLERHAPDILDAMLAAGGNVTDGNLVLPPEHHDDSLQAVGIRRQVIDAVLLGTARATPGIQLETATVTQLMTGPERDGLPTVTGVQTADGRTFLADLVIDASGRRTKFPSLVADIGVRAPEERSNPCGDVYYCRWFEIEPDAKRPPMFAPVAIRGSLGYLGFSVAWQDANVIVVNLTPESDDRELRALRSEPAFMTACRLNPLMAALVHESFAKPVSGVASMGSLFNTRRSYVSEGKNTVRGLVAIGDGICHTNPTPGYGMSMALEQAFLLPALVRDEGVNASVGLERAVGAELDERFEHVSRFDAERIEMAAGRRPDLDGDREFVVEAGSLALAPTDPTVLRRYLRRVLAVDMPGAMADDEDFMAAARAAIVESGVLDRPRPPTRDELLRAIGEADETPAPAAR